jgi:hypothetical protein
VEDRKNLYDQRGRKKGYVEGVVIFKDRITIDQN